MGGYRIALGLAALTVASACTSAPAQRDAANTTLPAVATASTTAPSAPATANAAPESIRALFGVETCGLVGRVPLPWTDTTFRRERRCFLDAFLTNRYVALIWITGTTEGDPSFVCTSSCRTGASVN
ncbi:MAG: hypothetical protein ABIQ73_06075 [Acidimicrobiales bacterium]